MATTDQIDLVGIDVPLRFKVGEAVVIPVSVLNAAGTASENITGRTYTARIGNISTGVSVADFAVSNADTPNGTFEFTMSAVTTGALSKGRYYWEAWEDDRFLCGGTVEIVEKKVVTS